MRLGLARAFGWAVALVFCLLSGAGLAQDAPAAPAATSPILILDQNALYERSLYGKSLRARIAEDVAKLEAESRSKEAELEAEERDLTEKRAQMSAEDFAPLAAAFDAKAQAMRAENAAAIDALRAKDAEGRKEFFITASEVLGDFMVEQGASAIVDKGAVIVSLRGLDVTDAVIARIDAVLGDGSQK